MKKKLIGTALFLVLPLAAQVRRVAVYDFDTNGVRDDVSKAFGSATKNVGAQVANRIISRLVNSDGGVDVIDRAQIDRIMKEQNLKFSDRFDPKDAPKLGRLLNVDTIVTGTVESLVTDIKEAYEHPVCHHPCYISWEEFQQNQRMIDEDAHTKTAANNKIGPSCLFNRQFCHAS